MSEVTANAYILYAFMAFQSLLLLALLGAVLRLMFLVGRIQGDINGTRESLQAQINGLREAIAALTVRVERLEEQVIDLRNQIADLREQVGEVRGSLRALHERVDLVMRHRHDGQTGGVILTPTAPSPEPVADPAAD